MSGKITVYISSVSSNLELKKHQKRIQDILDNKKEYTVEYVDIAASEEAKKKMRDSMGDPKGLPPQVFRGDKYLGDFNAFEDAVEAEDLDAFLNK